MSRMTAAQLRAASQYHPAGACTTCGAQVRAGYRNEIGQCIDCHNRQYHEYRAARKAKIEAAREAGRREWTERGIRVGDRVVHSAVGIFGPYTISGIAKVGAIGAYVSAPAQPGFLSSRAFQKEKGERQ